ncbi:MAG: N(4)-(beta-N-acetylglucosaminyl)-L-asparaginase [Flavobacteriales bacterium]|nr:N(4)-(beta-N-acetylglucosaminyl)-L-asparaginase [Flavobacteriales bacterium]
MPSRREFLKTGTLGSIAGLSLLEAIASTPPTDSVNPVVISTWDFGYAANEAAWEELQKKGRAIDAVEKGVRVPEGDPNVSSVGYGGLPDRDGKVTLDACIMDDTGRAGAVACLEGFKHPISVARKVMETTPHVMLVGGGARQFAIDNGFKEEDLLTEKAKKRWEDWKKTSNYAPIINIENHDTIGMLALDMYGNLSGACTTSGLAWKMHGRVGDSPLIGAGLFVDNEIGAATATGKGESVIRIAGSAAIVELMRHGRSPQEACEEVVKRIAAKQSDYKEFQVAFLAINKTGETGAYALQKGFTYCLFTPKNKEKFTSPSLLYSNKRTY